jgi:PAS domain S-box-containing protein
LIGLKIAEPLKSTTQLNLEVVLSPVNNDRGEVIGVSTIARNITDRVKAQDALTQSEAKFRALISQTAVGIYQADLNRVVTFVNDILCKMFGFEKERLIGQVLWSTTFKEDLELERRLFEDFKSTRTSFEIDKRIVTKTGEVKWVKESVSAIYNSGGELESTMGVILDITEAKLAEQAAKETSQKFEIVLESLPQMTWTNLPNGDVTFYNHRWDDYTGLTSEQINDRLWKTVVHPDDIASTIEAYNRSLEHGTVFEFENRCKKYDGSYRWHLSRALPVKNEKGEILIWVGTATDIHDQKVANDLLEKIVRDRTSQLERSNDDLLHFAHVASHDLKEPLRKIKTYCYRLEDEYKDDLPASAQSYIHKIHGAIERMTTMIDGVLSYSKLSADEGTIETIDLNVLIKAIEQDLEVLIQQKSATIDVTPLPTIEGSLVLMYQLFYNLINNALKFSKLTVPPVISIRSEMLEKTGNDYIVLLISDNGIGFEQKFAKEIFQTFTRLHSKDEYEGTGLGLALCYKIVQRHGGTIEATGMPGEGATFRIFLPKT